MRADVAKGQAASGGMSEQLTQLVDTLTSEGDGSQGWLYSQAIRLFEFQIELAYPGPLLSTKEGGTEEFNRARRMRRAAGLFATVKLLEKVEADLKERLQREPKLEDLSQDPHYARLYDEKLLPRGGLRRVRHLPAAKVFDRRVRKRWREARAVAELIDVSYRFDPTSITTRHKGGITTA